jgi:hypothetical protein
LVLYKGGRKMELYMVTDEEHLYGERVGNSVWEDRTRIRLDLGNETVLFDRTEVERIL